jgi:hypothetical protein
VVVDDERAVVRITEVKPSHQAEVSE